MRNQRGFYVEDLLFGLVCFACFVLLFGFFLWLAYAECKAKADVLGFAHSWGPIQGCAIEYKPGKWAPIERYRVLDEDAEQ